MAEIKHYVDINLDKNQLKQAVIENVSSTPSSGVEGQVCYNTTDNKLKVHDGSTWQDVGLSATSKSVVPLRSTVAFSKTSGYYPLVVGSNILEVGSVASVSGDFYWLVSDLNSTSNPQIVAPERATLNNVDNGDLLGEAVGIEGTNISVDTTYVATLYAKKGGLIVSGGVVLPGDNLDDISSISASISFKRKLYYGFSIKESLTAAEIVGTIENNFNDAILTHSATGYLTSSSFTIYPTQPQNVSASYLYVCIPNDITTPSMFLNKDGIPQAFLGFYQLQGTLSLKNRSGNTSTYKIYRSKDLSIFNGVELKHY